MNGGTNRVGVGMNGHDFLLKVEVFEELFDSSIPYFRR